MTKTWRLDDGHQTLVFASDNGYIPACIYWGQTLLPTENLEALAAATRLDVTGGMLDDNPPLNLCPLSYDSFPGQPGLQLRNQNGQPVICQLRLTDAEAIDGHFNVSASDETNGLSWQAHFEVCPDTGVISCHSSLSSLSPVFVEWLSAPVLPAPQQADEFIEFSGRWCGEFQTSRLPWSAGRRVRNNTTGRSGHEHFPGLYLPCLGASNTCGEVYAMHYGWSGGHGMVAEEMPDGRRQIQFAHAAGSETEAVTEASSARLYLSRSDLGLNGCALAFQRHLREQIVSWPAASLPRPVHYNCWEAVYFDHNIEELTEIAAIAAELGAERFVLDDGWFGRRDDDTSSLGDWQVDARKYPQGLGPLIDSVTSLGMGFGLWFEPEMVNLDSELARAHPDWILGPADQIEGRQQRVLDISKSAVSNYLFEKLHGLLSEYDIGYIKWDHNRVLPSADAAQARAHIQLLKRLRDAHPQVEIESCASGGGRIDFGVLQQTQRVWLSDSNDALERLRIQHDAALFLPAAVTGSHVGPRHCHTSGRVLDINLRAWTAAQRHFGFEMDPRELTSEEAGVLKKVCAWWKQNRDWLFDADILRLDGVDKSIIAEIQVARDASRFVAFVAQVSTSSQILPRPQRLSGLDPDASYEIELLTRESSPRLSRRDLLLKSDSFTASGSWLMQAGLNLPWAFPATIHVIEGRRLD